MPSFPIGAESDPGFFLIGEGRAVLESQIGFRPGVGLSLARMARAHPSLVYLVSVALVAAASLVLPLLTIDADWPMRLLMAGLALIPATDIAVTLVNRLIAARTRPAELPSLALRSGPTEELRTLVAVPVLLTRPDQVEDLVERLEVHYLANPEGELHFALVSDWADSETPELAGDAELLSAARRGVAEVERETRAGAGRGRSVPALPSPAGCSTRVRAVHMGWERKRGKLHELNRLLRGATDTSFLPSDRPHPEGVRYVIALDADSRLPPGAATRLVATIAHPLNRARVDQPLGARGGGLRDPPTPGHRLPQGRVAPASSSESSSRPPASTRMGHPSATSIRTCSVRGPTPGRGSTRSMPSSRPSTGGSPRTRCSAMICSKAASPGPGW